MKSTYPVLGAKEKLCSGCGACQFVCPVGCITMKEDREGFLYPEVNNVFCINCKRCIAACPAIKEKDDNIDLEQTWAAVARDEDILISSSSGGMFTLLALAVINSGGCVYGAAFSEDYHKVHHIGVEKTEEMICLRTSKYLQSDMEDVIHDIERKLNEGRVVLFSGTPCQVAGVRSVFNQQNKLICVDVICHGVPSPKLWAEYLNNISKSYRGRIISVNFRYKKNGWKMFGIRIKKGSRVYYKTQSEDPYIQMFLRNYCLRESCYDCMTKKKGSCADITIGDFWGVEKVMPNMDSRLGTSLVIIHTDRGRELFETVSDQMKKKETNLSLAIEYNSAYNTSVQRPEIRDVFFQDLDSISWRSFVKKYGGSGCFKKTRKMLGRLYHALSEKTKSSRSGGGKTKYGLLIQIKK